MTDAHVILSSYYNLLSHDSRFLQPLSRIHVETLCIVPLGNLEFWAAKGMSKHGALLIQFKDFGGGVLQKHRLTA